MGWRYRKSFSPFPGVRLNFSPRGISTSIGVGPARLYLGPEGAAVTARVPGTGISFRQPIGSLHGAQAHQHAPIPAGHVTAAAVPFVPTLAAVPQAGEIRSASTPVLTTEGLQPLKDLIARAQVERASLLPELQQAKTDARQRRSNYNAWKDGWLLRRLFEARFARLRESADNGEAKVAELEEQERLSRLSTQFDLPDALKSAFGRVCDATAVLSQSQQIWDTVSRVRTDRFRERTLAANTVTRQPVAVGMGGCDLIQVPWTVPHFSNANGGDVFIYPGFVLYDISAAAFALVDAREVTITSTPTTCIEEEGVPRDSMQVGQTWKRANKDGSPDKRFANNYQLPIVMYGALRITSNSGLNEEYMISNTNAAERFAAEWSAFGQALAAVTT